MLEQNDVVSSIEILKAEISLLKIENKEIKQKIDCLEEESEDESDSDSDSQYIVKNMTGQFKCEMCDFCCLKVATLSKHKNTKHAGSNTLGPGTFGCSTIARKYMEYEAEELRQTWRKEANAKKQVSFGDSLETSYVNNDEEDETDIYKQKDNELSSEVTDCDLPDDKKCQQICKMHEAYSSN